MEVYDLFHGTNGDNIISIMREGQIRPNMDGKIFFSRFRFDSVLMHGGDGRRKLTFALKVRVSIPPTAVVARGKTQGVEDTLIVSTSAPLKSEILEMYVREPRAATIKTIKGQDDIARFLGA